MVYTLFITMVHEMNPNYPRKGGAYIIVDDDISDDKRVAIVAAFLTKNKIKPDQICHDREHYICDNYTNIPAEITRIQLDSDELLRLLQCAYEFDQLLQQQEQQQQPNENQSSTCSSIDMLSS